ncbi:MAG: crossover junction endodeoxyribonuclease RuvC [Geminicoccaceae bacterium]
MIASSGVEGISFDDCILGLDIASTLGWGVVEGPNYESGEMTFESATRLPELRIFLQCLIRHHRPALIVAEEVFINPRQSTKVLLHMHGVMLELVSHCPSAVDYIGNTEAKNMIAGHGGMTAQDKKNGAMVRALALHGFSVDGTDAADGMAIALTMRKKLFDRLK